MDIVPPPKRPLSRSQTQPAPSPIALVHDKPAAESNSSPSVISIKPPVHKRRSFWALIIVGLGVIATSLVISWYHVSLKPKDASSKTEQHVVVTAGDTSSVIVTKLAKAGLLRSPLATRIYIELTGVKNKLQTGGYALSPNQPVSDMIAHIVAGKTDEQLVTIPPGLTLKELRPVLEKYGYSDQEITTAYSSQYTSPLLADKPVGQSLEGYIFPESFNMTVGQPLSELFERTFDELYGRLQTDGLIEKFKARGLNLHQAITLASIVQKEVANTTDQRQVAQVFYSRLSQHMVLGSDVTFEYAAAQLGVTPAVDIDSLYNTRQNPGLPPGPIANMNYSALQAVADPAAGDYLYFVAGDDGKTYYGRTVDEHEANVAAHCHDLCNVY